MHINEISRIIKIVQNRENLKISNYMSFFSENDECEGHLFFIKNKDKHTFEEADSIFNWIINHEPGKHNSIIMEILNIKFAPIDYFRIGKKVRENENYARYEVIVKTKTNTPLSFYFDLSKIKEEGYSFMDIFDEYMNSIICHLGLDCSH